MVEQEMQTQLQDNYAALMMGYAAGSLDQAQSLIVSAHVDLSPKARDFMSACEEIGGALLDTACEPQAMRNNALDDVLARLDVPVKQETKHNVPAFPGDYNVPDVICGALCPETPTDWRPLMPGFQTFDLDLACKHSKARFLQVEPGVKSPHHSHGGLEITLVLDGAFTDETGHYNRGDLIVSDDTLEHTPLSCPKMGCMCMVVSTAPIKLTGIASLLNPFLKN